MSYIPKIKISPLPFKDKLIQEAFQFNQLVTGPHIKIFEDRLAQTFGFKFANTTASGYSALFLALKSLKLNKAKVVIPAISTCHAITNAVLANGFEVVFCDLDPNHMSLCDHSLLKLYQENPFDAIIAPSHFGIPAPIEVYRKYGVPIIEDACQAFFTRTNIKSTADLMVLSFYPTKQFNCIEGGAILHNSFDKSVIINDLRYYDNQQKFDGTARYNFRMANLNAAFGCLLMENLYEERNSLLRKRDTYITGIKNKSFLLASQCDKGIVPWRFLIKSIKSDFFTYLKFENIQTDKEMIQLQGSSINLKQDEWFEFYQSIPFYSNMNHEDQEIVIRKINEWN